MQEAAREMVLEHEVRSARWRVATTDVLRQSERREERRGELELPRSQQKDRRGDTSRRVGVGGVAFPADNKRRLQNITRDYLSTVYI